MIKSVVLVLVLTTSMTALAKGNKGKTKDKWVDGTPSYKVSGVDTHFATPEEACKAGVDDLAKHGNHKTYDSVKDGTSSTMMTCVLKEADGSPFEQTNSITKILECPETTSPRSTDNSGDFAKIRCHCDDDKKGCPAAPKK
jgi:hypothetical protein